MACVIICKNNGQVLVNALPEAPPEYLQGAVPAESVEEATQMASELLSDGATGQEGAQGGEAPSDQDQGDQPPQDGDQPPAQGPQASNPQPSGTEGMPVDTEDDQMAAGFQRAKKGY